MKTLSASTTRIVFNEEPFQIQEITNELTGELFCLEGKQTVLIRVPDHISEPAILVKPEHISSDGNGFNFILADESGKYKAEMHISSSERGIRFHLKAKAPEPLWLVEWKLSSFDFEEVIIPALGGQTLTKEMTPETTLSYKYPFWWNAQFVIGAQKKGGLWLHTKDTSPDFKMLRVSKGEKDFSLTLGFEATAPLRSNSLEAEWFIETYKGSWRIPAERHRKWMEKGFGLKKLNKNPRFPAWAKNINFILEMWGMRKDTHIPHHTFDEMKERLIEFSKMHSPEETLVYVPGFAEHGIDSNAPDYNPSIKCGGDEKFKELVDLAHEMGYHVMIHTNVLAMTFHHRLYAEFKQFQVVDVFNRTQGWALDIDGDWLNEEYFAYMNPGYKQWGDLMEKVLGELISKYKLDGVFLDQTLLAFNESRGPNFITGMREHLERLESAFPDVLFSGEGIHEQVLRALPMAQIHGIDSLADVHGMEGKKRWRRVHPVSSYIFSKYTRLVAHLLTRYPSHPLFKLQEASYKKLNIIPALCLYNNKQKMDRKEVLEMLKRAKELKFEAGTRPLLVNQSEDKDV